MSKIKKLRMLYARLQEEREADSLDRCLAGIAAGDLIRKELASLTSEQRKRLKTRSSAGR